MVAIKSCLKVFLLFLLFSCSNDGTEIGNQITAKVIAIKDGDTIEALFNGKSLTIRLAHIDCPEIKKGQPFGRAAKKMTSDLCFGQRVKLINEGKYDRYRRLIAVVINENEVNVNKELVRAGLAWHFKKYSIDTSYENLELSARSNKIGLWIDGDAIAPWNWRKSKLH